MPGERVWVYNPTRKKRVTPKLTSQWVEPCEVLRPLGTLPLPGGWTFRHTQLDQHSSTHTDESSDSNRHWGVGACDSTGSHVAAAASPSLSGHCFRLTTGDMLVGAM